MRRFLAAMLVALTLVAAPVLPAIAIQDIGDQRVTRLWSQDDRFMCTGFYVRSPLDNTAPDGFAYVLTAGHCAIAPYLRRNKETSVLAGVNWQIVVNAGARGLRRSDFAFGNTPEIRDETQPGRDRAFWFAAKFPEIPGSNVYIHGFPRGIERVTNGFVVEASHPLLRDSALASYPNWKVALVPEGEILPGSSGSPVIDDDGRVVGILWGIINEANRPAQTIMDKLDIALITPIEEVLATIRMFEDKR